MSTTSPIKQIRDNKSLTQAEFAKKIGMNPKTYAYKEQYNKFSQAEIRKIGQTLKVEVAEVHTPVIASGREVELYERLLEDRERLIQANSRLMDTRLQQVETRLKALMVLLLKFREKTTKEHFEVLVAEANNVQLDLELIK